jgi:hypothetical protein
VLEEILHVAKADAQAACTRRTEGSLRQAAEGWMAERQAKRKLKRSTVACYGEGKALDIAAKAATQAKPGFQVLSRVALPEQPRAPQPRTALRKTAAPPSAAYRAEGADAQE